jgi:hypothetical protein
VFFQIAREEHDAAINGREVVKVEFQPVYRSGVWSDTGRRPVMEDAHVRIDDLETHLGPEGDHEASGAFYGVSNAFPHWFFIAWETVSFWVAVVGMFSIFPEANHKQSATICVESVGEALLLFPGVAHSHQGIHLLLQFVGFSSCIGLLKTLDLEGSSHSCGLTL